MKYSEEEIRKIFEDLFYSRVDTCKRQIKVIVFEEGFELFKKYIEEEFSKYQEDDRNNKSGK